MAAITGHIPSLRRQIKNVACNYSEAQVKVREATSNDPWGASSSLMSEISDLTYNAMAFTEIMQLIWKRLNDSGKNWRHVYKSLVLLDYLIKVGSEKVAHQCRENIFAIQTLKDFQHIEDNKDQGMNVREKAKQLVAILKDDERLKNERAKALMAKKRFTQNGSGLGSDGTSGHRRQETCRSDNDLPSYVAVADPNFANNKPLSAKNNAKTKSSSDISSSAATRLRKDSELDDCRPTSAGEEELQLQIALALSKEEAERESEVRKNDDVRLQLALQESEKSKSGAPRGALGASGSASAAAFSGQSTSAAASLKNTSALDDLLSLQTATPVSQQHSATNAATVDPWGSTGVSSNDFIGTTGLISAANAAKTDPWGCPTVAPPPVVDSTGQQGRTAFNKDPWSSNTAASNPVEMLGNNQALESDPWETDILAPSVVGQQQQNVNNNNGVMSCGAPFVDTGRKLKTPDTFLGENSALVNLENLMSGSTRSSSASAGIMSKSSANSNNPFATSVNPSGGNSATNQIPNNNPFAVQQKRATPTLNEMRTSSTTYSTNNSNNNNPQAWGSTASNQPPFQSNSTTTTNNTNNSFSLTTNPFL